jgi:biotin carboxylase
VTRLLVLGGARKSRPLVEYAVQQGIEVILCDRDPEAACRSLATVFEQVSTLDVPALIKVGRQYGVHGVVSFGSDRMAESTADVAAALRLPGNPPEAVRDMGHKHRFRRRLAAMGLPVPRFASFDRLPTEHELADFTLPLIVKPVDGAGSAGVGRVDTLSAVPEAWRAARQASASGVVVVEEYIERDHPHMIGGDVFVSGGKVVFWGLLNSHRVLADRPFLPTGTSWPVELPPERDIALKAAIGRVVAGMGIQFGGMNIEAMFDQSGRLFVIEMAARNGGNDIPDLLRLATGFSLAEAQVEAALGRPVHVTGAPEPSAVANYMLHADRQGRFRRVVFAEDLEPYVDRIEVRCRQGDRVTRFSKASHALGTVTLRFPSHAKQHDVLTRVSQMVQIELEDDS